MEPISTKSGQHLQHTLKRLLICIMCCMVAVAWHSTAAYSQYYSKAEKDGFVLTKFVSDTEVNSGRAFEYHVTFSIPAGATSIVITDLLPPTVEYISSSYYVNQTCPPGTQITPTVTLPVGNPYGGIYQFVISAAPCGAVGSFTIVGRFPCGITCDSTSGTNSACIRYRTAEKTSGDFCTKGLTTYARAKSTWTINKQVQNMAYQGGNCPNAVNDSVVRYCLTVSKSPGTEGQLNLLGATVTDMIPAGAYVKPGSSCIPATTPGSTPTMLTWNVGNLSACLDYNSVSCCFDVVYPRALFPVGSQVSNTAILLGQTGSTTGTCRSIDQSSTVCSEFKSITRGYISKWATTNGQPGCAGRYYIQVCNNGNAPLLGISAVDALPGNLIYGTPVATLPPGWSISFTPGAGPQTFTLSSGAASLPVGGCVLVEIPFTISTTAPPGAIQNCVTLSATGTTATTTCYSFAVTSPHPIPCLSKAVCNKKSTYSPGDVFTYRLRIQNIGGQDLSGATITDALDPNLVYIGNVRAYSSSNYAIACGQPNSWGPVTATFPAGPNTVKFAIPTIPYNCNATGSCGQNGTTVPFYFVEFDVKVSDSSALGSINNVFTISGGTLQASAASNIEGIIVSANTSYWLEKGVRSSSSDKFSTTATAAASSGVEYRLMLHIPTATPQLAALRNVSFIDLLPKDNAPAAPNDDKHILTCNSRGSLFNVSYGGSFMSTSNPLPIGFQNTTQYPNIRNWQPTGAPPLLFNSGCSINAPSAWSVPLSVATKNPGFYFGVWAFTYNSVQPAWVSFTAQVDAAAKPGETACNTFVAGASVRYIVNGSITQDIPIAEAESQEACLTAIPKGSTCLCDSAYFEPFTIPGLDADYRTIHVVNRHGTPITWIDIRYYDCATGALITDLTRPVIGGGLKETRTGAALLTLPISSFVPPYRRVPTTGNLPAWPPGPTNMQDEVMFNVGFNYFGTVPPTWCMKLIIHHEEGDSCMWDMPRWTPHPPSNTADIEIRKDIDIRRFYVVGVNVITKNPSIKTNIGFVTFSPVNPEDEIRGGSGGSLNSANDIDTSSSVRSFVQSRGTALFRVDMNSSEPTPIEVFVATKDTVKKPMLIVRVFDKDAGILTVDTVEATSPVTGIISPGETGSGTDGIRINSIIPNPASGSFTCNYTLGASEVIRLELFTTLGQSVAVLTDGFQYRGQHQLNYDVAGLADGMYYLRLSTRSGTVSAVVNITH